MRRVADLAVKTVLTDSLKPYAGNARAHNKKQVSQIARSIKVYGWTVPILVDADRTVIAGHGRLEAAKSLGLDEVPIITIDDLTPEQVKALRLADNKIAENARWDEDLLKVEIDTLIGAELDFEITDTGFEMAELDVILADPDPEPDTGDLADQDIAGPQVAAPGDLFACGRHFIMCADARDQNAYGRLLGNDKARAIITDPPYNVPIGGHVSSTGRHGEFAMASGEMSDEAYRAFLGETLAPLADHGMAGALVYLFIDWRHVGAMIAAGEGAFGPLFNLCVWDKGTGAMGSLYRSAHELACVFKNGRGRHLDNVQLGRHGRNRTNVWRYRGLASFGKGRSEALSMHPTVKPVAMIADAILDCTNRSDIVLDPFAGSGTALIAAERTGRCARVMEIDPAFVDVALRRYRRATGDEPLHVASGKPLSDLEANTGAAQRPRSDEEYLS
ncbi:MAG: DNA methyltransferase [Silicimonas sp.]|jgi:hypothetical protein|uniref:site-specific DNA-methyltransferase n=1 Tax=Roseitalea porphyridii TaxID=1852022 RepID=UPI0032ED3F57